MDYTHSKPSRKTPRYRTLARSSMHTRSSSRLAADRSPVLLRMRHAFREPTGPTTMPFSSFRLQNQTNGKRKSEDLPSPKTRNQAHVPL